jgi:preprotein translocase subunit YajC
MSMKRMYSNAGNAGISKINLAAMILFFEYMIRLPVNIPERTKRSQAHKEMLNEETDPSFRPEKKNKKAMSEMMALNIHNTLNHFMSPVGN